MTKRVVLFLAAVLLASPVLAAWNIDINDDGCIDQDDLDLVVANEGVRGSSDYDVTGNLVVDQEDIAIVTAYIERGTPTAGCDGFLCKTEICNTEDDDCDGNVDEDEDMCDEGHICLNGECTFNAGDCFDSDGYNLYAKGKAIGFTPEDQLTEGEESCYEKDIYGKLKKATGCYGDGCFLLEYSCSDADKLLQEYIVCEYGCRFGRCRNITKKCLEEDNGLDIFRKSEGQIETSEGIIKLHDTCEDQNDDGVYETLVEYECLGRFDTTTNTLIEDYKVYEITCDCENGICKNVVEGPCVDTDGNNQYVRGYIYGQLANGSELKDFDFCMLKDKGILGKVDRCSGDICHMAEYSCDYKGSPVKFIHECPLGCIEGMCIGTECGRDEWFTINEGSCLGYDGDCEYLPEKCDDLLDMPSSRFQNLRDFACCKGNSEAYCVYKEKCYPSSRNSNYYEFSGEVVVCGCSDSTCNYEDGNHVGLWYDLDSSQDICEGGVSICNMKWYPETGFRWIKPGESRAQEENTWEYEDNGVECCGDDQDEFVVCEGDNCICCDSEDDAYDNGECSGKKQSQEEKEPAEQQDRDADETSEKATNATIIVGEPPLTKVKHEKPGYWKNLILICTVLALVSAVVLLTFGRKRNPPKDMSDD